MNKKVKVFGIIGIAFLFLFLLLVVLLKTVDVRTWQVTGTEIGLYKINAIVNTYSKESNTLIKLASDGLLVLSILLALAVAVIGIIELVKRKSIFKVDKDIIVFGCGLIVIVFFYLLFSLVKINYRPILKDGAIEDSFPSTHTMLVCFITIAVSYLLSNRLKNKEYVGACYAISGLLIFLVASGRIFSNQHWFTDVVGAVLLSLGLVFIEIAVTEFIKFKMQLKEIKTK